MSSNSQQYIARVVYQLKLVGISKIIKMISLKVSNEGLEFDDGNELIKRGLDMIKNPESLKSVSVTQDDKENFLNVSMRKVFEITLKTELRLLKAPPQIVS